mgnify:CR=1 FL=1
MKVFLQIFCILLLFVGCNTDKNKGRYVQKIEPRRNFEGIGIITFPTSFHGTFRVMNFYPVYEGNKEKLLIRNIPDTLQLNVKNVIVIRGKNDTDLWNSLRLDKSIEIGEHGLGMALIYVNFLYQPVDNPDSPFGSGQTINGKYYDTKTYNTNYEDIKIIDYKIIRGLKE